MEEANAHGEAGCGRPAGHGTRAGVLLRGAASRSSVWVSLHRSRVPVPSAPCWRATSSAARIGHRIEQGLSNVWGRSRSGGSGWCGRAGWVVGQGARAGLVAGAELDEMIVQAGVLDGAAAQRVPAGLGTGQPVALAGGVRQLLKQGVGGLAVEDDERRVGQLRRWRRRGGRLRRSPCGSGSCWGRPRGSRTAISRTPAHEPPHRADLAPALLRRIPEALMPVASPTARTWRRTLWCRRDRCARPHRS